MSRNYFALSALAVLAIATAAGAQAPGSPIYKDKAQPVPLRVADLLQRMTNEEKVRELSEDWGIPGNERLGIPPLSKAEATHGFGYGEGATIFPQALGLAATWNTKMAANVGDITGQECLEANTYQAWCPVLDVARDPRWGRMEETFGEDPYLVSRIGVSWIKSYQSHNLIATPKHFAAHGAPLGGRDSHDVGYSDRVMREVFLVPFRAAFMEAKAGSVMNAYTTWTDGVPCAESQDLLFGILRQEWGFDGFVVSDCGSIDNIYTKFGVSQDKVDAARKAIEAGVSCNCGDTYKQFLLTAVQSGQVSPKTLDFAVGRILTVIFRLGLFDRPITKTKWDWKDNPNWDSPAHRQVALNEARESIVLLKNTGVLPLSKAIGSVAVIGPNADEAQLGDYSTKPKPGQLITVLAGVKAAVSPNTKVTYAKGCEHLGNSTAGFDDAVKAAQASDVAIVVLGDKSEVTTGENWDRANLDLPGVQQQLLEAIAKVGKPVILVLVSGKPATVGWAAENIPAIVETWFPGEEGGHATADVLFGDYNPGGRLPVTFPRSSDQLPLYYNYKPSGRAYNYTDQSFTPLYRFGYGLSYTKFAYSNLKITPPSQPQGNATISADITNTGSRAGDEVAQLYINHSVSSVVTPVMELKGFQRIHLDPNQKVTVTFTLTPYDLSILNRTMDRVLEPGAVKIMVGGASPEPLTGDEQKAKVGYVNAQQGVMGTLTIKAPLAPKFVYDLSVPASASRRKQFIASVRVTNAGGMTDVGEVQLFANGQKLSAQRFELNAGQKKTLEFPITLTSGGRSTLTASGKYTLVTKTLIIN
ncbi:MAG: glycoside hydrolase family 3 C-terminal domain-containing protein [Capsulimonas sp.]|uniref:glycoside hydrolase family 3 C-terminal domain-containing protein n=1 Tax=Capsulimonas sp. TaxID=2494211 RepID=UPI003267EB30